MDATATLPCPACRAPLALGARFCGACGVALAVGAPPPPPPAPIDPVGREIGGRYRVIAKLGEGGMGAVYRAEQLSLRRVVALKLLRPELSSEASLVRRFNAEAELAARLAHPNTVTLFDFGQDDSGALFIAMELLEGTSLRGELQRGALPIERALHIAEQIAASLADAHAHGIVHRDLKPDNVMLTRRGRQGDVVRVVDFGIAKLRDEGGVTQLPMTQVGDMLGTPQYMAPEQIRAEKVDARTDVYALGAILYEMATGQPPFEGATVMAILSKHLGEPPVPPSRRPRPPGAPPIPPPLEALILAALAKAPAARPPSMEAMAEAIAAVRGGASAIASPPSGFPAAPPSAFALGSSPQHGWSPTAVGHAAPTPVELGRAAPPTPARWPWLAGAVVIAVGIAGAGWWASRRSEEADASPNPDPDTNPAPGTNPGSSPGPAGRPGPGSLTDFSLEPVRKIYGDP